MNCCSNCFCDSQIRRIIKEMRITGNCDFCDSRDVEIYPIGERTEIEDLLTSVIDLYTEAHPGTNGKFLHDALSEDWGIFSGDRVSVRELVSILCPDKVCNDEGLLPSYVAIPQLNDKSFLEEYGLVKGSSWSEFSESIKYGNRYHSGLFNSDAFASYLSYLAKWCMKGDYLFRARICSNPDGFPKEEMGIPPVEKRTAGRINPEGVGVLYLSSDKQTALNEVRASANDYITVGKFKLLSNLKIVDFSKMAEFSPFIETIDLAQYAVNRRIFFEISKEIAKPLRRSDSSLEYLPTQYISEFIKSQKYSGVMFVSTMNIGGYNLVIYDNEFLDNQIECIDVEVVEVQQLKYETRSIR